MIKLKLKNHPGCNHSIQVEQNRNNNLLEITFISYKTEIVKCYELPREMEIPNGFQIFCNPIENPKTGNFSRSTARQLGYFIKEYFPELHYSDLKEISISKDFIHGRMDSGRYEFIKNLF